MKASMPKGIEVHTGINGSWCVIGQPGALQPGFNGTYIDAKRHTNPRSLTGARLTQAEVVRSGRVTHRRFIENDQAPATLVAMAKEYL